jgi:hypothetical protein
MILIVRPSQYIINAIHQFQGYQAHRLSRKGALLELTHSALQKTHKEERNVGSHNAIMASNIIVFQ